MRLTLLYLALILCFASTGSNARIYRWVDDNGVTVYTQIPPQDRDAEEIAPPTPPSAPVKKDGASAPESLSVPATQTPGAIPGDEKAQADYAAIMKRNCEIARRNLTLYQTPGDHYYKTRDGNYQPLTAKIRAEKIAIAEKQIEAYCKQ